MDRKGNNKLYDKKEAVGTIKMVVFIVNVSLVSNLFAYLNTNVMHNM